MICFQPLLLIYLLIVYLRGDDLGAMWGLAGVWLYKIVYKVTILM